MRQEQLGDAEPGAPGTIVLSSTSTGLSPYASVALASVPSCGIHEASSTTYAEFPDQYPVDFTTDIDGDGDADAVTASWEGVEHPELGNQTCAVYYESTFSFRVYLGPSAGSMEPSSAVWSLSSPSTPVECGMFLDGNLIGDVDANGTPDWYWGTNETDSLVSLGADGLRATPLLTEGDGRAHGVPPSGDLDGDGLDDLVVHTWDGTGAVTIWSAPVSLPAAIAAADGRMGLDELSDSPAVSVLGDLDGDGRRTVVVLDTHGTAYVLDPGFSGAVPEIASATVHISDRTSRCGDVAAADLDADGRDDLLLTWEDTVEGGAWLLYGPVVGTIDLADAPSVTTQDMVFASDALFLDVGRGLEPAVGARIGIPGGEPGAPDLYLFAPDAFH